jgi:hypothetical protein
MGMPILQRRRQPRFFIALLLFLLLSLPSATTQEQPKLVFFYSATCAICARAKPLIDEIEETYPDLVVERYEVSTPEGKTLFGQYLQDYGADRVSVPGIFFGRRYWIGYSDRVNRDVRAAVGRMESVRGDENTISLPLVGELGLSDLSVFASTALIALVDGFNPCSLWLLTFLLGVVVHTKSRAKTVAVGLTFLSVTAALYGLFIVGVFGLFIISDASRWIRYAVVVLALTFGVLNVKDYFALGRGPSLTFSGRQKTGISKRIHRLMLRRDSPGLLVLSTAGLAAGVTFVELPCTAGFPVIWTRIVASQGIRGPAFATLLGLYLLIYLADELLILTAAIVTLRRAAFEEKHGRLLKLLGGTLMLGLGLAMLVAPLKGGSLQGVATVFAVSIAVTASVHLIVSRRRAG